MAIDKKQIAADLASAHQDALEIAEANFQRQYSPSTSESVTALRKLVKLYQALALSPATHSNQVQVGSVVIVRMGANNEKRTVFIYGGFLIDPMKWSSRYSSSRTVTLGSSETFVGLKVGDTYVSHEGRPGDQTISVNHIIEIL